MNIIVETLQGIWESSGFSNMTWQSAVMIVLACVLLYLGIVKKFEPLLLVGIAFGMLLTNLPTPDGATAIYNPALWEQFMDEGSEFYHSYGHILANGGFLDILYIGVKAGIYPSLIFLGVGAMTDYRRCGRTYRDIPNVNACTCAFGRDSDCGVQLHGAYPAYSASADAAYNN